MDVNNQNIIDAVEILKSKRVIDKDIEIGEQLGYTRSVVSSYLNNKVKASRNFTDKFFEHFGSYFENNVMKEDKVVYGSRKPQKGVPYYDIDIAASNIALFNDSPEFIKGYINIPEFNDAEGFYNIWGPSMYKSYPSGSIVALKRITDFDVLVYGECYVIVTSEQRVVKRVRKSELKDHILLESEHKDHDAFDLPRTKIKAVFKVLGSLQRNTM